MEACNTVLVLEVHWTSRTNERQSPWLSCRHCISWIQYCQERDEALPVQVIALIAHLKEAGRAKQPFLILVPASLMANWEGEIAHWAPSLQVVSYRGKGDERETIFQTQAWKALSLQAL